MGRRSSPRRGEQEENMCGEDRLGAVCGKENQGVFATILTKCVCVCGGGVPYILLISDSFY